jgi:hypothetical protein
MTKMGTPNDILSIWIAALTLDLSANRYGNTQAFFYPKNRMIRLYQVWFDVLWVKDTILMAMKKIRI